MKRLLIIWHSRTGAAEALAAAAARGAEREPEVQVVLKSAAATIVNDILQSDGFIFAAPENLGALSGAMKEMFDTAYYGALDQVNGRPYAQIITAGSDGQGAARQLARIVTGWRLKVVAEPLIVCTDAQTPQAIGAVKQIQAHDLAKASELGAALATGLAMGIF